VCEWLFITQLIHATRAGILEVPVIRVSAKRFENLEIYTVEYFEVNIKSVTELLTEMFLKGALWPC
jgi:hypothetical protein